MAALSLPIFLIEIVFAIHHNQIHRNQTMMIQNRDAVGKIL